MVKKILLAGKRANYSKSLIRKSSPNIDDFFWTLSNDIKRFDNSTRMSFHNSINILPSRSIYFSSRIKPLLFFLAQIELSCISRKTIPSTHLDGFTRSVYRWSFELIIDRFVKMRKKWFVIGCCCCNSACLEIGERDEKCLFAWRISGRMVKLRIAWDFDNALYSML